MTRDTILDRLEQRARTNPLDAAMYFRNEGRWDAIDWKSYRHRARQFGAALVATGHRPGEAVAIMGYNCPEWLMADVGAMSAGGVPAGIYHTCTAEQAAYIVRHCEARTVVVENKSQWEKIRAHRDSLPKLERVVMIREHEGIDDPLIESFRAFCARANEQTDDLDARMRAIRPDDLATLIYTSGTTGAPKGAMLSHRNLVAEADAAKDVHASHAGDTSVCYLPLAHIAEQMTSIHIPITAGYSIWIAESMDKVRDALLAARPTLMMGVPRVWEKLKSALEARFAEARGPRAELLRWARDVGARAGHQRLERGAPRGALALQYRLADRLVFSKIKAALGLDRLRVGATGAAPISRDVLEFFLSIGIVLFEVYGQTETAGASTSNRPTPSGTRIGSVGTALRGVQLKIADDGEVLVRGDIVFLGYYKDEAATRETVVDGWLHTGDIGQLDERGFLKITDRKKDLIITSGGKNVAPQEIERKLRGIDGIAQAVVIGDRRNYLTALLTLDPERCPSLARQNGWPEARDALATHPPFRAHVERSLESVNATLARYESIKRFALLPNDFTVESGELTPTAKIKRRVVNERHATTIERLYTEGDGA